MKKFEKCVENILKENASRKLGKKSEDLQIEQSIEKIVKTDEGQKNIIYEPIKF